MKKKGFTLMELLAVIVLLAVIALIAIPILLSIIEKSRKGAFKDSVLSAHHQLEYFLSDKELVEIPEEGIDVKTIGLMHNNLEGLFKPDVDGEAISYYITDGRYCAYGRMDSLLIERGCERIDLTPPYVEKKNIAITSQMHSISVLLNEGFVKDEESNLEKIKVVLYEKGENGKRYVDENTFLQKGMVQNEELEYTFDKLKPNTNYQVVITITNENGMSYTYEETLQTKIIDTPRIDVKKEPSIPKNAYVRKQTDKIMFTSVQGFNNYIQSTREGEVIGQVLGVCGNEEIPTNCIEANATTLQAGYWYQVGEEIEVNYTKETEEVGTLLALSSNGEKEASISDYLFKIDTTSPELIIKEATLSNQMITIPLSIKEMASGIKEVTCNYSIVEGEYTNNGTVNKEYTTCTLANVDANETYYYEICVQDYAENERVCKTGNREPVSYVKDIVKEGEYIRYTPSRTSYTISTADTVAYNNLVINPSELNIWRVIRKNANGTVDIVSEYVSSKALLFGQQHDFNYQKQAYQKYVATLNKIASAYETTGYTVGSRHMGYDATKVQAVLANQYSTPDSAYTTDTNLVSQALGTLISYQVGTSTSRAYWLASREQILFNSGLCWGRRIMTDGTIGVQTLSTSRTDNYIRPIVVLKADIKITGGSGTKASPYTLGV